MRRQWFSEPPAISSPNRWMTHASFIAEATEGTLFRLSPFLRFSVCSRSLRRLRSLPLQQQTQARVLDRQLLDAREQQAVHAVLAPEVFARVLQKPPRKRQQHPPLHQQNDRTERGPMARERQLRPEIPVAALVEQFRQEEKIRITTVSRMPQERPDPLEQHRIAVLGGTSVFRHAAPDRFAHLALDPIHHRLRSNGGVHPLTRAHGSVRTTTIETADR